MGLRSGVLRDLSRVKPRPWTRSNGCCLRSPRKRWTTPGFPAGSRVGRSASTSVASRSDNMMLRQRHTSRRAINSHTAMAGTFTMLSNRISFVYDLRGPSMTIDTACSSSLVALHEATQAIARGEIELALVGGVNAMLIPETSVTMCKGRFLAEDGHCKTFDAAADGYARGEGAGVLVLKPLADAYPRPGPDLRRHPGHRRQPGRTHVGHHRAQPAGAGGPHPPGAPPSPVCVRNRSGTSRRTAPEPRLATRWRWPLSATTLGRVEGRTADLVVGSIKNSIGHLEAAAGVASVIKAALTLHHRQLAPQATAEPTEPGDPFRRTPAAGDHRGRTLPRRLHDSGGVGQRLRLRRHKRARGAGRGTASPPSRSSGKRRPTCCRCPGATRPAPVSWPSDLLQLIADPAMDPGRAGGRHVVATVAPQPSVRRAVRRPR